MNMVLKDLFAQALVEYIFVCDNGACFIELYRFSYSHLMLPDLFADTAGIDRPIAVSTDQHRLGAIGERLGQEHPACNINLGLF